MADVSDVCVCICTAATGEVGPLLQRTAGVKSALGTPQLRSFLCSGGQEHRYCNTFIIVFIDCFVYFILFIFFTNFTQHVIGLIKLNWISLLCSHVLPADEGIQEAEFACQASLLLAPADTPPERQKPSW